MAAPRLDFVELPCGETAPMRAFYASVFDWEFTAFGPTYACTSTGDVDLGLQADRAEAGTAPLPVVRVADLEAALAAVERAGGEVIRPIFAFPGGRRFHFRDPAGNELATHMPDSQNSIDPSRIGLDRESRSQTYDERRPAAFEPLRGSADSAVGSRSGATILVPGERRDAPADVEAVTAVAGLGLGRVRSTHVKAYRSAAGSKRGSGRKRSAARAAGGPARSTAVIPFGQVSIVRHAGLVPASTLRQEQAASGQGRR